MYLSCWKESRTEQTKKINYICDVIKSMITCTCMMMLLVNGCMTFLSTSRRNGVGFFFANIFFLCYCFACLRDKCMFCRCFDWSLFLSRFVIDFRSCHSFIDEVYVCKNIILLSLTICNYKTSKGWGMVFCLVENVLQGWSTSARLRSRSMWGNIKSFQ